MVYRLTLAYRGTAYSGWQRQPNALAVQEVVEDALSDLLGKPLRVVSASRTDAGVHAEGQVVHLDLGRPFPTRGLVHGTNHRLPEDIRILAAQAVRDGFHARYTALGKRYRYRLSTAEVLSPLAAPFVTRVPFRLDPESLRAATAFLPGRHDFTAFALAGGSHRSPVRTLFDVRLEELGQELVWHFAGDGFLRGMIRGLVGTLLEVGSGRRSPESFAELLRGAPREAAGPTAPARGLTLLGVDYPAGWEIDDPS